MNRQPLARPWWLLPPGRLHPLWWAGIGVLLLWLDYAFGIDTTFPVFYFIPVTVAAWYSGRWPAVALGIGLPLAHAVVVAPLWLEPAPHTPLVLITIFRAAVVVVTGLWFARLSAHEQELHRHVDTLEGLLPICTFCKNIRNEAGEWERLETFISNRSEAQFSHGFCPACGKTHYAEYLDDNTPPPPARVQTRVN